MEQHGRCLGIDIATADTDDEMQVAKGTERLQCDIGL